jgi:cytochrome c biogenesis protein CcdA/thioredoxin-related protein
MKRYRLLFLLLLISPVLATAQDTAGIDAWTATAKKIAEGKYELSFKLASTNGWQLYAPNQVLSEVKTTELGFEDSAITQAGDFVTDAVPAKVSSPIFTEAPIAVFEKGVEWKMPITIKGTVPARLQGILNYSYGKGEEFNQGAYSFTVSLEGGVATTFEIKRTAIDIKNTASPCGDDSTGEKGLLKIFLLGLLGGLIALITPCVFPMIPVTVTFFTKKSVNKRRSVFNGILYGLFIFLIYVFITVPFHIAGKAISPEIFNNISTNVWLNLVFFAIFVFFALSFFGLFEIGLPSGLANKADSKSGLGNIGGIFFMAATLAIVSFSCTGPLLGTLLVGVADQGAWPLTVGAAGFGLALGLPFALFALFPQWLQSLPKSGGWMTDVKVVLGLLELALAVKFLSNADLVKQWGLLKRETFVAIWVIIALLAVLYLLGILKKKHLSSAKKFSFIRIATIIFFVSAAFYIVPGLLSNKYSPKLLSGFLPPRTYSYYYEKGKLFEPIHNDYEGALKLAKEKGKPVLIDFTGWACVNCRRMEEKAWPDNEVDSLMRNEFIVVSLYVDEKRKLPLTEQAEVTLANGEKKSIVSVGDKWATFQTENFGATSQPQYAIISPDEKLLTKTKFYTPDATVFAQWLQCGIDTFKKTKK